MRQPLAVLGLLLVFVGSAASQSKPEATAQSKPESSAQVARPAPAGTQKPWLRGVWEGTGYQTDDDSTWTMKLTVTRTRRGRVYSIDYPSLNCGGRWKLLSMNRNVARFRELISRGQDKCTNNGLVVIERKRGQIVYLYTNEGSREITASAVLNRKTHTPSGE